MSHIHTHTRTCVRNSTDQDKQAPAELLLLRAITATKIAICRRRVIELDHGPKIQAKLERIADARIQNVGLGGTGDSAKRKKQKARKKERKKGYCCNARAPALDSVSIPEAQTFFLKRETPTF